MSLEETAAPETYELHFTVQPGDIDMLGHVNNIVYLRWVQDIAIAHWGARAPREDQDALYWVVTRHEIDYKRSAMPGDTIRARTWIGKASRFAFERHTEILRASDGKLLVKALTLWCPMSRATNKPVDVRPEVRALFSVGMLDEVSPAAATGR
ncbi:MAG: acyl-CoA thioesterase [Ignavibacteriae bacterium]|nr:acyl-CoA thioesterase [Ignavibacteriota bacterium]